MKENRHTPPVAWALRALSLLALLTGTLAWTDAAGADPYVGNIFCNTTNQGDDPLINYNTNLSYARIHGSNDWNTSDLWYSLRSCKWTSKSRQPRVRCTQQVSGYSTWHGHLNSRPTPTSTLHTAAVKKITCDGVTRRHYPKSSSRDGDYFHLHVHNNNTGECSSNCGKARMYFWNY